MDWAFTLAWHRASDGGGKCPSTHIGVRWQHQDVCTWTASLTREEMFPIILRRPIRVCRTSNYERTFQWRAFFSSYRCVHPGLALSTKGQWSVIKNCIHPRFRKTWLSVILAGIRLVLTIPMEHEVRSIDWGLWKFAVHHEKEGNSPCQLGPRGWLHRKNHVSPTPPLPTWLSHEIVR